MDADTRIQQFKQMSEADPDNELGHFSLGKAYIEAGRYEDAIAPLTRVIELKPKMSKAYQMLGDAYDKWEQRDHAIEVTTRGVTIADEKGDRMPRDAMAEMLRRWNAPVPAFQSTDTGKATETSPGVSSDGFQCTRCGRPTGQLPKSPFKGPLGENIHAHVCDQCWREWVEMGTKVINEMGLVLSSQAGQDAYDQHMVEFLQLDEYV